MKLSKKLLSLLLCTIMIFGSVAIGGDGFAEVFDAFSLKASAYSTGDYIYYGTYPQTDVTDSLGAVLNNQPGTWVSYNYYSGSRSDDSMKPSNYMRYKDVSYNGEKYRAVTFDTYRPYWTGDATSTSCETCQVDNGYYYGNVYWFKYEPIRWRILDPSTGLIMCNTILDSQAYNNYILSSATDEYGYDAYWGDAAKTYYANNYAKSSIREWLNKDFYNTAFSSSQQSNILYTTFDNSAYSTSYSAYDSESTTDKVFLLSYDEVMNSKYGFTTSSETYDSARQLKGSDYAKSQGLYVDKSSGKSYNGCSRWRLRSPGNYSSDACNVDYDGNVDDYGVTCYTFSGVVPALRLQNLTSDYADYIYYGTYPQTDVTDSLGAVLNNQPGTWVSYNYYSGTGSYADGQMKPSNYMRYKDVSYNGNKYRAVTFDTYRPSWTGLATSTSYETCQVDNGYYYSNVYWFKYEPIKWRILDPSTGLIMCDTILDSQAYNNYVLSSGTDEYDHTAYWGDAAKTYYANNYAKSSIRKWLNDDFYNTAFSSSQQSNILYTTLDNSTFNTAFSAYDSESTTDKVFLLSYDDVLNSKYGFSTSIGDSARQLKGSDYAKSQGLGVYTSSDSSYDGCSHWRLRSAGYTSDDACCVCYDGYVDYSHGVYRGCASYGTYYGVVPALRLLNLKSDYAGSDDDGLNSYIKGFVSDLTVDYKSSVILHANFDNIKGENITWYVNGNVFAYGDSIILDTLAKDSAVYCEGVDSNGKVYKSDVENIYVRTSFWIRLKAFFKSLFGLLPIIDQK